MPATRPSVRAQRADEAREVGRRLALARERARLSQLSVARQLGVSQSAIAKLELGSRQLRFTEGLRLALLLRVDPGELMPTRPEPSE